MSLDIHKNLKHDLRSDISSIMSAIKIIKDSKSNSEETNTVLNFIAAKEDKIIENLEKFLALRKEK